MRRSEAALHRPSVIPNSEDQPFIPANLILIKKAMELAD
jgi:hypothetical protein